jgi:membrane fusion protein (multidrug efflux system)
MSSTVDSIKRAIPVDSIAEEFLKSPGKDALASKRRFVFGRLGLLGLVLVVGGLLWWLLAQGREETDDAYVDGHISNLSSRISGTISSVLVTDNQLVKKGQLLVELDPGDYQVKVDQYKAALEKARHTAKAAQSKITLSSISSRGQTAQASGDLSSGEAQIASAQLALIEAQAETRQQQAKIDELEAQAKFAASDLERYRTTYEQRVVTKQQFDKAKNAHDVAIAQLAESRHGLAAARGKEAQYLSQIKEAEGRLKKSQGNVTSAEATTHQQEIDREEFESDVASVQKAEADLHEAILNLSYTKIVAPVSGRVGRKSAEVGQRIEAGQNLLAIVQDNPWITANFKETQVGRMRPGQSVALKIDSFNGKTFRGKIDSIAPASGAKFSMLPPDNATGNFTKIVQRVAVKIVFDDPSIKPVQSDLSPGMSCVTTVFVNGK